MTSTQNKIDTDHVELTVELTRDDLAKHIQATEDVFGREIKIDGFRPGKVPRDMIRKHVGEARILESALETAIQRSLAEVLAEQKIDVIEVSDLKVKENSVEKLLYTVQLHVFPDVKLPALGGIKVPRKAVAVEPVEIDQALETIRASRAILTDSTEPALKNDRLEVDFQVKENGTLIEGGESTNHPVVIGKENFVPGFEDQLIGLKKGDHKDFSLPVPKDFANTTIAGKTLDFSVTVKDIKKVSLPELTDEFAKTLGKFENMDQLILNVKDGLLQEKEEKERQRVRLEIMNALIGQAICTVPAAMIEDQLTTMMQNFDQDLHRHNMELGLYLAKMNKTQEDIKKEWRPEAERQVKMALILHAIGKDNDIAVSREETDQAPNLLNEKTFEFLEKVCIAE